jgi:hypothetical protein
MSRPLPRLLSQRVRGRRSDNGGEPRGMDTNPQLLAAETDDEASARGRCQVKALHTSSSVTSRPTVPWL